MGFKRQAVRLALVGAITLAGATAVSTTALAARTKAQLTPPATPAGVAVTVGSKAIIVSWSDASTGVIRFIASATASGQATKSCTTESDTCRIGPLVGGVDYRITVIAKNKAGSSAPSDAVMATIGTPGAPTSVLAVARKAGVIVHWAAPTLGRAGITSYTATATGNAGRFSCSTHATVLTGPARTCTITGLTSGISYSVAVIATNQYGSSSPSAPAEVVAR